MKEAKEYKYLLLKHYDTRSSAYTDFLKLIGKMCKKDKSSKYFSNHKNEDNRMVVVDAGERMISKNERILLMKYRFADTNDLDLLVQLRLDFLEVVKEDAQYEVIKDNSCLYFRNALHDGLCDVILVEDEYKIVGTAIIFYYNSVPSTFNVSGKNAYVTSMYVKEEYRRKGIATTMLKQLIDVSNKKGYPIIMLNASEMGKTLYKKFGFTEIQNGMILKTI